VTLKASVGTTPDGQLRLEVRSIKTAGIPAGGLLKLFGLELDDMVKLEEQRGVRVRDNDIVIAIGRVMPSPAMQGRLKAAYVKGNGLVQVFGSPAGGSNRASARSAAGARNYVWFLGGTIRFGRLTMTDTDLQLIDADPRDPFDFFPGRYITQLAAGYSKTTLSGSLRTYMPDFDDVARRQPKASAAKEE
jgi:hypothetical protein